MVRVLQVVTDMNMGGIESFLMNLYRSVDREQVQFDFLMHRAEPSYFDEEILAMGGRIYRLPAIRPVSFPRYRKALSAFFREHREYRVIHAHNNAYSMFVLREAEKNGVPVRIAHSHCAFPNLGLVKRLTYDYCRSRINRFTTRRFACSSAAGEWLYSGAGFEIFPNAIHGRKYRFDPNQRESLRQELQLGNAFTLMHVGRFDAVKNQAFLLEVFAEVLKQEPETKLVLVGDGSLRPELQCRAEETLPAGSVIFTGIRSDVARLLQAADVFVFPSLYEGLPVTVIEAQAAGLPCIKSSAVTDEVCVTELVSSLPIDDASAWAQTILEKRSIPRQDTYAAIRESGFDMEAAAQKLQQFYLNGEIL